MAHPLENPRRLQFAAEYPGLNLARIGPAVPGVGLPDEPVWFALVGGASPRSDLEASLSTLRFARHVAPEMVVSPWVWNNLITFSPGRAVMLQFRLEPAPGGAAPPPAGDQMIEFWAYWRCLNVHEILCPARFAGWGGDAAFVAAREAYQVSLRGEIEKAEAAGEAEGEARARLERQLALTEQNGGFAAE